MPSDITPTWTPPIDAASLEVSALLIRREDYAADGILPVGVKVLTCGVDVQDDRLVYLVVGWGDGEESWLLDYDVIPGDPG